VEISRIRENGTKVFNTNCDDDKINACRIILHDKHYAKINGIMVDLYTASAIVAVYEKLSEQNKAKFVTASIEKMAILSYRLLEKIKQESA
jgi:hypothetical protein